MTEAEERCHATALRILGYRFNSEMELRRKLARKQFDRETVDGTITRLRTEGWLDDARFAGAMVRSLAARQVGRNRIARELQAVGVDSDITTAAIAENLEPEAEEASLRMAAARRARMLIRRNGEGWLASDDGRNKLTGWLLKQGYDAGLVREVVKEIVRTTHD